MTGERLALTTGANSGIGLATALEFARRGLRSVGTVRSRAKAVAVAEAARSVGITLETAILDVTDAAACDRIIRKYRPSVLVNSAGYSATGAVEDVGDDEARSALETMVGQLLGNLSLLFVPAGVGIMMHLDLIESGWLPIGVALLASTALTIAATGLIMQRLAKDDA